MNFYGYDENKVYNGSVIEHKPKMVIPKNYTHHVPPEEEGIYLFIGNGWETLTDYPTPVVVNEPKVLTQYEFRSLFTVDEKVLIEDSTVTDTKLRVIMRDLESAEYIDLSKPEVLAGLDYIVSLGILNETRKNEILA